MTTERLLGRRQWIAVAWTLFGFILELILIPLPHSSAAQEKPGLTEICRSADFSYSLAFPFVIWWWFRVFLRRRVYDARTLGLACIVFGFYISSALRGIAEILFHLFQWAIGPGLSK